MKISLTIFSLAIFFFTPNAGKAQTFTKSSVKFATGYGSSENSKYFAGGYYFSVGYQRDLYKDRIRINPNFTFGVYSNKGVEDASYVHFNSLNLQCNVFADVFRIGKFSYVMGVGVVGNNIRGLDANNGELSVGDAEFFSDYNVGGIFSNGFRINNPDKRVALEIILLSLQYCTHEHIEINPMRIGIDVKF